MALTLVTGGRATHWTTVRPGSAAGGTPYTALVSDIAAGDYLCGIRATVTATGSTVSGNRTVTVQRPNGFTFDMVAPAASGLLLVRP